MEKKQEENKYYILEKVFPLIVVVCIIVIYISISSLMGRGTLIGEFVDENVSLKGGDKQTVFGAIMLMGFIGVFVIGILVNILELSAATFKAACKVCTKILMIFSTLGFLSLFLLFLSAESLGFVGGILAVLLLLFLVNFIGLVLCEILVLSIFVALGKKEEVHTHEKQ